MKNVGMNKNYIFSEVQKIILKLYLVGGAIRNEFLGFPIDDWDFATPLLPDEVASLIKKAKRKSYNVGKRFGTVGLRIDGVKVEITTFRTEKYLSKSRKPQVTYVKNITSDLSRRDFTCNALAWNGEKYIDPFEGRKDLENKVIRCVGKPSDRFKEDPLRLLRCARMSSQLDFNVDIDTFDKAKQLSYKILEISKERWMLELDKILLCKKPSIGLELLASTRLLNYMIPELALQVNYDQNSPYHSLNLWNHTLKVVDNLPKDINLRWAGFCHDIGKPACRIEKPDKSSYYKHEYLGADMVEKLARHLKWSNDRRETVKALVLHHMDDNSPLRDADLRAK